MVSSREVHIGIGEVASNYENLKVHSIFEPIKIFFEFYVLGIGFIGQPHLQKAFLASHPDLTPFVKRYNAEVDLKVSESGVTSQTGRYWVTLGRIMAIALFDILESSKYQNTLNREEIFKFAKHLRNGAAHNNKFNIAPPIQSSVRWRNKIIDNSLHGKTVFSSFIDPVMLLFLMADISELIEK